MEQPLGTAYVLYCLAPSAGPLQFPEEGVFQCDSGNISAIVSEVRREDYCGPDAQARMQDLAWIGPRACRHEAVVEHVMSQGPVLPAPFATLFTSSGRILQFIEQHRDAVTGFFQQLGDCREWAVKGMWDAGSEMGDSPPEQVSGREYLLAKRSQGETRRLRARRVRESCREAARQLAHQAAAFRERRVFNLQSDEPVAVLSNGAFLLWPAQEPQFRSCVEDLNRRYRQQGLTFLLSGPWPPYSFAPVLQEASS